MNILWVSPFLPKIDAAARGWSRPRPVDRAGPPSATRSPSLCRIEPARAGRRAAAGVRAWPACTCRSSSRPAGRAGDGAHRRLLRSAGPRRQSAAPRGRLRPPPRRVPRDRSRHRPPRCRCPSSRSPSTSWPARRATGCIWPAAPRARLGAWLYWRAIGRLQRRICRKFDRILTLSEHDRRTLLAARPRAVGRRAAVPVRPRPRRDGARVGAGPTPSCSSWAPCTATRTWTPCASSTARSCRACGPRSGEVTLHDRRRVSRPAEVQRLAARPASRSPASSSRSSRYYGARDRVRRAAAHRGRHRRQDHRRARRRLSRGDDDASATTALGATPGRHLLVADAPGDFAAAVMRLLRDPAQRQPAGRGARARSPWSTTLRR